MRSNFGISLLAVGVALASTNAQAEDQQPTQAAGNTSTVNQVDPGEIIVTAQKRSERLNSVPLAISAIGASDIASRGITDTTQLSKAIPSFNVQKSSSGQPIFYIRGVGFSDPSVSISPAVSVYTDEAPLSYSTMARGAAFDLERVEVLKGPQGTLFGQNSTGGAVNYIAAKPTDSLAAGFDLEAGRFNMVNASGFVSAPVTDTLGIRVAVQSRYQDDWQRSISRGDERGQQRFYNGRVTLAWAPSSNLRFQLTGAAWKDQSDNQAPQFVYFTPSRTGSSANQVVTAALSAQTPAPDNSRLADWDPGSAKAKNDRFYQIALRGEYDLPWATLTSLSSYADTKINSPVDVDGTPFPNAFFVQKALLQTFSQELRLNGTIDDRLRWLFGGNYQHSKTNELMAETTNITNNSIGPYTYDHVNLINDQRVDTYAIFGSLEYKLTDRLTARASGRYTWERRKFSGCLADAGDGQLAKAFSLLSSQFSGQAVTIDPGHCVTLNDTTSLPVNIVEKPLNENNFSWRAGLDWQITSRTLLYANIAKGYKSGGFTHIPAVYARQMTPITQESVLAYEGGLKTPLFDRLAQLNASIFYYDYRNKQLQGYINIDPFGALPTLVNVPKSRVYGAEADLTVRPWTGLRLQLSGAYLDTKATSSTALPIGPLGSVYNFTGESFPNTPKYQITSDVEQRFPISSSMEAYIGGSVQYRSSASAAFGRSQNALSESLFTIPSYALLDARAGMSFNDGKAVIEIWGRNITNKFYVTSITRQADTILRYTGMPATYGIRLSWKY
ncbi:TonB-dependent receptor [Novosphingobium sp.]|uniref:TonB-dependent receptor n=1 Tax=Novosphingobium sp. TaxID=1874826 RepID=UPI002FE0D970